MVRQTEADSYSKQETEQRLQRVLKGAFRGPPTPLKDIPRKRPYRARKRKASQELKAPGG